MQNILVEFLIAYDIHFIEYEDMVVFQHGEFIVSFLDKATKPYVLKNKNRDVLYATDNFDEILEKIELIV